MSYRSSSLTGQVVTGIDREIGSQYDNVRIVAENLDKVAPVATNINSVSTVADNIGSIIFANNNLGSTIAVGENIDDVLLVANSVVPNLAEILLADDNATIATNKAAEALSYRNETEVMKIALETLYDTFDDRFLGALAVEPTLDNDGNALISGALYFNSSANAMSVYDTDIGWIALPQIYLSALLDVELTSITTGHILKWNGTKWSNSTLSGSEVTYENTTSGLSATTIQAGIDELEANKADKATTLAGYGISDAYTKVETVSTADLAGAIGRINSPLLDLDLQNSLNMKAGKGSVNFSRATTATYIDRYGVLQYADVDEPRFEKDGLLIEGASTNLCLYSNEIATNWSNSLGGTGTIIKTQNYGIAPDGTQTADRLQLSLNGGTTALDQSGVIMPNTTTTIGVNRTYSVWLKSNDANTYMVRFDFNGVSPNSGDALCVVTPTWKRFIITLDNPLDTTRYGAIRLRGTRGTSDTADILVAYGQGESLPFASSYIPTTSSAVTRSVDDCYIDNTTFAMQSKLSIHLECTYKGYVYYNHAYSIHCTDEAVEWSGLRPLSTHSVALNYSYGGNYTSFSHNNDYNRTYTVVMDGATNKQYYNGVLMTQETLDDNYVIPDSRLYIGRAYAANTYLFGHIKQFKMYDKTLTSTEIALLG